MANNNTSPTLIIVHPYVMVSIKVHVLVTLEMQSSNYTKWASFKSMCGKFGLKSHIDGSVPPRPDDPQLDQVDCCVQMWIFDSIADSVLDLTMVGDAQTACTLDGH